jgi:hypothetical protein
MKPLLVLTLVLSVGTALRADDLPDPAAVTAAMRKANDFFVSKLASHGGFARAWKRDLSLAFVEGKESKTIVSIQPHGTTTVGMAMLKAWQATGDKAFLDGARGAAKALIDCQLESGGWPADFDFEGSDPEKWWLRQEVTAGTLPLEKEKPILTKGKQSNSSTLDDNKTQSALLFLLELAHDPAVEDLLLQDAVNYAFDHLLAAQTKIGSWPQQFSGPAPADGIVKKAVIPAEWPRKWPNEKYTGFHTLNDGNLHKIVELMLRAHQLTGDARYLDAAKRCGDFLLLAQFDGDQPAWAQQYNEEMVPVWARKFEPPAVSSTESLGACFTLFEIWIATGEEKYRATIPAALDYLEKVKLPNGRWSRFYEFGTNKPLYCVAETYELTYDDSNLPTHYGFQPDYEGDKIERLREDLAKPREELLASRKGPDSPERWLKSARNLRGKVNAALESRNDDGVWIDDDLIDAELFVKHMNAMALYVDGMKRASNRTE